MAGLNKVMIIGNLGRDPEMKFTANGTAVTNFSVAVSESHKRDGEWQQTTEWFSIVAWTKLAETCYQYLKKGSKVYLEGRLQTQSWESNGEKKSKVVVIANSVLFLDKATTTERTTEVSDEGDIDYDDLPF